MSEAVVSVSLVKSCATRHSWVQEQVLHISITGIAGVDSLNYNILHLQLRDSHALAICWGPGYDFIDGVTKGTSTQRVHLARGAL